MNKSAPYFYKRPQSFWILYEFRKLSQLEIEAEQQALYEKNELSNNSDEPDEPGGMDMNM